MTENIKSCHCVYSEYDPVKTGTVEIAYYQSMQELINVEMLKVYFGEEDESIFSVMGEDVLSMVRNEVRHLQEWEGNGAIQMLWLLSQQNLTDLCSIVFLKAGAYIGRRRRKLEGSLGEFECCAIKEVYKFVEEEELEDSHCSTNSPAAYLFNCSCFADGRKKEFLRGEVFGKALALFEDTSFYTYTDMQEVMRTIASMLNEDAEVVSNCLEFSLCRRFLQTRSSGGRYDSLRQFINSIGRAAS